MATGKNGSSLTIVLIVTICGLLILSVVLGFNLMMLKSGSLGQLTGEQLKQLSKIDKEDIISFIDYYEDDVNYDDSEDEDYVEAFNENLSPDSLDEAIVAISYYEKAVNDAISNPSTENNEKLLDFIDPGYVSKKGITASNISKTINKKIDFTITKIMGFYSDSYFIYACDGIYVNPDDSEDVREDYKIAIVLSTETDYYSIIPFEAFEDNTYNFVLGEVPDYSYSIPNKGENDLDDFYNSYTQEVDTILRVNKNYIKMFKLYAFVNTEKAYNLLEESYRQKTYGSLDAFKRYVSSNSTAVYNLDIVSANYAESSEESESMIEDDEEYEAEVYENDENYYEEEFICKDNTGRTLKIHQNKVLDFTIAYTD